MRQLFLVPLLMAVACTQEPQNAAEIMAGNASDAQAEASTSQNDSAQAPPAEQRVKVGKLTIAFDPALLTPVPAKVAIPPDWKAEVDGRKFLAADRAQMIDKAECIYGQSGKASRCNVPQEAGLSFASLDRPYQELAEAIPAGQRKTMELAGVSGLSWQIGAEGEGAEYILLPAGQGTGAGTILIVRQFRTSGNPDATAVGKLLADLTLQTGA